MDNILTSRETAETLDIDSSFALSLFEEGLLTGFKLHDEWRISAGQLRRDLDNIHGIQRSTKTSEFTGLPVRVVKPSINTPIIPIAVENPTPGAHDALGQLLVFSDVPGQEVYLDGELKGSTTLSIMNILAGEHVIQIGDMETSITVLKDTQLRVRRKDDQIRIPAPSAQFSISETSEQEAERSREYRLSIDIENQTDYTGPFAFNVTAEMLEDNAKVFGLTEGELHPKGLRLSAQILAQETVSFFNDTVKVKHGDRVYVSVHKQDGFRGTAEQVLVMQEDLYVKLVLSSGKWRSRKNQLKFRTSSSPH